MHVLTLVTFPSEQQLWLRVGSRVLAATCHCCLIFLAVLQNPLQFKKQLSFPACTFSKILIQGHDNISRVGAPLEDRKGDSQVAWSNEAEAENDTLSVTQSWTVLALPACLCELVFQTEKGNKCDQSRNVDPAVKQLYAYKQSPGSPTQHYLHINTKTVTHLT